jgi:hypothetical protein
MPHEFTSTLHQSPQSTSNDEQESRFGKFNHTHTNIDELVHDLRQPLSTIECLTYYLELVCEDAHTQAHLQRIQEMLLQANHILERASNCQAH